MSSSAANIVISEDSNAEQEETRKASRMMLKEVQNVSTQKENCQPRKPFANASSAIMSKDLSISTVKGPTEPKRTRTVASKSTQTTIEEEEEITADIPSEGYWKKLAETRRLALQVALDENLNLRMDISELEESVKQAKAVISDLGNLVDTLTEMVGENRASKDTNSNIEDDSGIAPCIESDNSDE